MFFILDFLLNLNLNLNLFFPWRFGMRGNKEHQEICVVGRLFSLEALLVLMGVVSLVYGAVTARTANILAGLVVVAATILVARLVRRMRLQK